MVLLIAAFVVMPFSLFSWLFSPSGIKLWGVAGFAVSILTTVVFAEDLLRRCPSGLVNSPPGLRRFDHSLKRIRAWTTGLGVLALAFFYWAHLPGTNVGEGPIFQRPGPYEMNNHGKITSVSRARYLTSGVCGHVGWHLLAMALAASGLRTLLFGEKPLPLASYNQAERTQASRS